jgi:hypothetical protein
VCPCVAAVSPDGCDAAAPDDAANPGDAGVDGDVPHASDGATDGMVFNGIVANPDAGDAGDATVFHGIVVHPGDGG